MKKLIIILACLAVLISYSAPAAIAQDEDFDINIVNQKVLSSDINNLDSRSFILMEMTTGEELFSKNADNRYPMASLTKIMTTYIVMGEIAAGRMSKRD